MNTMKKLMAKAYTGVVCASVMAQNAVMAWCDPTGGSGSSSSGGSSSSSGGSLGNGVLDSSGSVIDKVAELYTKWGILVILVSAIEFFVSKDERKKGMAKNVLIGSVIAYGVALLAKGHTLQALIETVLGWFNIKA